MAMLLSCFFLSIWNKRFSVIAYVSPNKQKIACLKRLGGKRNRVCADRQYVFDCALSSALFRAKKFIYMGLVFKKGKRIDKTGRIARIEH
ncbi:hypothetical protein [Salinisphaera aquimarina]|uniref:Secreted protein n=1 Tax=Salinisphaera aquimarina TaxID=2094031 RepID=A0ABV7ES94_9GAMM